MFCSSWVWGAPLPMQRTVKPTTRPAQPVQSPVRENYAIAIEGIEKDRQCNIYYLLRNTGANLTLDQLKRSYAQFGDEARVSLATADPTGKLGIRGNPVRIKTGLRLSGNPQTIYRRYITVTLFNGKEIKRMVMIKGVCLTELPQVSPQQVMPQVPVNKEAVKSPQVSKEILLKISRKKPLAPLPGNPALSASRQKLIKDLSCSVSVSYDQNNTQPILPKGVGSGTYMMPDGPRVDSLVWVHVLVDFTGIKKEQTRALLYKVLINFKGLFFDQDLNYNLGLEPGESHEFIFAMHSKANIVIGPDGAQAFPLQIYAKVDTTNLLAEDNEQNNTAKYTVNFDW